MPSLNRARHTRHVESATQAVGLGKAMTGSVCSLWPQKMPSCRGRLGHLVGRPRGIQDDLDCDVVNARELPHHELALPDQLRSRGTHGAGHGHFRIFTSVWPVVTRLQIDAIDQSQNR